MQNKGLKPKLEILDEVPFDEQKFWESHYIWLFKSFGCPLLNGNYGDDSPVKHTADTIRKISESRTGQGIGQKRSNESKKKMSDAAKNRSAASIKKIWDARRKNGTARWSKC